MPNPPCTAAPTKPPEQAGGTHRPEGITRFLALLRWIIIYGKTLADALHQHGPHGGLHHFVSTRFRTSDLNEVFARIKRGLMLALALEAKLVERAATGRDIPEAPVRSSTPGTGRSGTPRKARAKPRTNIIDLPLDRLPTAEEIAEELRRRPFGAVLVDICRDLGILPGDLTHAQQNELLVMVTRYGGSMVVLLCKDLKIQLQRRVTEGMGSAKPPPADASSAHNAPACPTGPPALARAA